MEMLSSFGSEKHEICLVIKCEHFRSCQSFDIKSRIRVEGLTVTITYIDNDSFFKCIVICAKEELCKFREIFKKKYCFETR